MLRSFKIYTCTNGTLGLHLSRAPWDPYPWVSSIQKDSNSYQAGLRIGDCLLELNGQDVLGMKISEIAALLKNHWLNESSNHVTAVIWRNKYNSNSNNGNESPNHCTGNIKGGEEDNDDDDEDEENNAHNINQQSLQKFATCLQHIAQLLECPVCLEVIKPPGWQCCNGHVLCNNCRSRSEKCPVCRVPLGPRGRCLLSDKLFTLLADSFPCDGVRSNKNSPKDRRKCSTEFHNQPKMAIAQKHHQQQQLEKDEQQGVKKAKDFLFTSIRQRRRKISNSKMSQDNKDTEFQAGETKEENKHPSMQKLAMYETNTVVASSLRKSSSNRKSAPDYKSEGFSIVTDQASEANIGSVATALRYDDLQRQTSTIQQCHCITCFKSVEKTAVNNITMMNTNESFAALNKYTLRLPSQGQLGENVVQQQQQQNEENFQSYQCPTGKLCCLMANVLPPVTYTSAEEGTNLVTNNNYETILTNTNMNTPLLEPMTNNNLSTATVMPATKQTYAKVKQTVLMTEQQHQLQKHQVNSYKFQRILKNEWDVLTHLTVDHKLPVNQYYAVYGQRITVQCLSQQHSITCLNLRGSEEQVSKVEKFFLACLPLEMPTNATTNLKMAIFLYHMKSSINGSNTNEVDLSVSPTDEVSNFETIIENPLTGIKWFGRSHSLCTPWSHIYEKQHFFQHYVQKNRLIAVAENEAAAKSHDETFVIVIKRK